RFDQGGVDTYAGRQPSASSSADACASCRTDACPSCDTDTCAGSTRYLSLDPGPLDRAAQHRAASCSSIAGRAEQTKPLTANPPQPYRHNPATALADIGA